MFITFLSSSFFMKLLDQGFFSRDTVSIAQSLLGKIISVNNKKGRIVEVEAYVTDAASHAFKKTPRSALMYDTYGFVYVYLVYGMYYCLNFTSEKEGTGAVLIRGVEDLESKKLISGPGKVCLFFGIDKTFNGVCVGKDVKIFNDGFVVRDIKKSGRIGIQKARELEWRFYY